VVQGAGAVFDGLTGPVRPGPRNAWIVLLGVSDDSGVGAGVGGVRGPRGGGEAVPAPAPPGPRQRPVRVTLVGRARRE
jgi:hypothetical protein